MSISWSWNGFSYIINRSFILVWSSGKNCLILLITFILEKTWIVLGSFSLHGKKFTTLRWLWWHHNGLYCHCWVVKIQMKVNTEKGSIFLMICEPVLKYRVQNFSTNLKKLKMTWWSRIHGGKCILLQDSEYLWRINLGQMSLWTCQTQEDYFWKPTTPHLRHGIPLYMYGTLEFIALLAKLILTTILVAQMKDGIKKII